MIDIDYVRRMARYNRWQNENLYGAADGLSDAERRRERGAFFGSIHGTLGHLLWADRIWMSRLAGWTPPEAGLTDSTALGAEWAAMRRERATCDDDIVRWADALEPGGLAGEFSYFSQAMGREMSGPRALMVTHVFNHQTHHRGQVHCMLTQAGARPHDTDLSFMPE